MNVPVHRKRILELTKSEWLNLGRTGMALLFVAWVFWPQYITFWTGSGLLLTVLIFGHMLLTAWRCVPFPGLVAFAACLQWVLAPWLARFFPPTLPVFRMSVDVEDYLRYAVPATVALWVGLLIPVHRTLRRWPHPAAPEPLTKHMRATLDVTIVVGMLVDLYGGGLPESLRFLTYLVSTFRFFAALGWMITETPGWWIRVAVVLLQFAAQQSTGGVFYLVVQWGGYFLLVYAFIKGWRWQLAGAFAAGLITLFVLQQVKPVFRDALRNYEVTTPVDSMQRLGSLMWDRVTKDSRQLGTDDSFGDTLVRFNQGWIVARVMTHVPKNTPYASGDTLIDAAIFSVVPRFLVPSKREGASQSMFMKYTGIELGGNTRMGLGAIGELYANFGTFGGILGTFIYGLLLGWLFAVFAERAVKNPLWWAAAAVVVLPGSESGQNIEDILNHVVKAGIVFILALKLVPVLNGLLSAERLTAVSHPTT